jgi:hypothetical protein
MAKVLKSGLPWMSYIRTRITGPAGDYVSCGQLPRMRNEKCHGEGHDNVDGGQGGNAENCCTRSTMLGTGHKETCG